MKTTLAIYEPHCDSAPVPIRVRRRSAWRLSLASVDLEGLAYLVLGAAGVLAIVLAFALF